MNIWAVLLAFAAVFPVNALAQEPQLPLGETTITDDFEGPRQVLPTIYYITTNADKRYSTCPAGDLAQFHAMPGQELFPRRPFVRVCRKFYKKVLLEGSGGLRLRDGSLHIINYIGREGGLPRFAIIRDRCPYGLGSRSNCLQPYISIAADASRYKVGDVIYIPEVAKSKLKLPDGDIHRGFFIVADTGDAIDGIGRFDFFTGVVTAFDPANPFTKIGLSNRPELGGKKMNYYRIRRGSDLESKVQDYYKDRTIEPKHVEHEEEPEEPEDGPEDESPEEETPRAIRSAPRGESEPPVSPPASSARSNP